MEQVTVSGRTEEEAIDRLMILLRGLPKDVFNPAETFVVYKEGMYYLAEIRERNQSEPKDYNDYGCFLLCARLCEDARTLAERGHKSAINFLRDGWISKALDVEPEALERSLRAGSGNKRADRTVVKG